MGQQVGINLMVLVWYAGWISAVMRDLPSFDRGLRPPFQWVENEILKIFFRKKMGFKIPLATHSVASLVYCFFGTKVSIKT
jgi:hypothetical protein